MNVTVSPRGAASPSPTSPVAPVPRQANTTETPPPAAEATTPPAEKKDDFLSPKFAALARQEKQIRQERERFKAERESWEREKSAHLNGYIPKDKLKSNFLGALEEAGTSYDEVAQQLLNSPAAQVDPTIRALQAKIQELEANQASFSKKQEETQSAAYKQAVDTIRNKVTGLVESNPEFEMIKALEQTEAVVALIEETFKSEGYVMSEEDAAKEVEEHLAEEAYKMAGLEKIKKLLNPQPAIPAEEKLPVTPQQPQLKTLTHAVNAVPTPGRRLTEKQRIENAKAIASGQPKPHN
jgi:hypothetical protein